MKYKYRIWDKLSPVNNRTAEKWLELYPYFNLGDVFIVTIDGNDAELHNIDFIRNQLDMPYATDEEVMRQYVDNIINEREQEPVYVQKNAELKKELFQAKLTLMKEGLI